MAKSVLLLKVNLQVRFNLNKKRFDNLTCPHVAVNAAIDPV